MSNLPTLTIEHGDLQLTATLPEVFQALSMVLPVVNKFFGSSKSQYVSSRDLHAALEVKKDHSSWVAYVVKQYDLVEDMDYFVERLDKMDPANWPAIKANGGKVPAVFLFPPKLAARIATMTKTEMGMRVWEYMYAVTDAAHDAVVKHYQMGINKANAEALLQKSKAGHFNALLDENTAAMNKLGTNSASIIDAANKAEQLPIVRAQLGQADAAAKLFWEATSTALRYMKQGKHPAAQKELEYAQGLYGNYSDALADELPWHQ